VCVSGELAFKEVVVSFPNNVDHRRQMVDGVWEGRDQRTTPVGIDRGGITLGYDYDTYGNLNLTRPTSRQIPRSTSS
jgi:hypothetical protein